MRPKVPAALSGRRRSPSPTTKAAARCRNETSRYDTEKRIRTTDGWEQGGSPDPADDEDLPPLRTTLTRDATRTIIARNTSPDIPFDRSINPYRGCEHGCIYCFARPTHAYLGLSPGLDFETKILFKPEAATLLTAELASPKYRCDVVAMGTNTDPYQPVERDLKITRQILRVLSDFNNPVGIVTKNHLITRDIDILADMAKRNLAEVFLSVTTLDTRPRPHDGAARLGAASEARRDPRAVAAPAFPSGVMTAPMIPGLNDHEMEAILDAAAAMPAPRGRATRCCACRSRSRTCSRSGCAPTGPTAPSASCRWSARCAAVRSTRPSSARA